MESERGKGNAYKLLLNINNGFIEKNQEMQLKRILKNRNYSFEVRPEFQSLYKELNKEGM